MKIIRYISKFSNNKHYGVLKNNTIYPILNSPFDNKTIVDKKNTIKYDTNIVLPPCKPTKIIAVALNYKGITGFSDDMSEPLVFLKSTNTIVSAVEKVKIPFKVNTWGESELGIVIKKETKNIKEENLNEHILGYVAANDISCTNVENRDHHLARSKSADGFCPIGHYIDTNFNYNNKSIKAYHNDILLRQGNTDQMIWKPKMIITWLSKWMTLYPGDLVMTGTPSRIRDRLFLKNGDKFTVKIEGFPDLVTYFYD